MLIASVSHWLAQILCLTLCILEAPEMGTLANSEDSDEMLQNTALIMVCVVC